MRRLGYKIAIALILSSGMGALYLWMPQTFFSLDKRLRDFLFIVRGELPRKERVVIVDIDEKSLRRYGQWPWSREKIASLLYKLTDAGAGIIGMDIVFAEKDGKSPARFKNFCPEKRNLPDYDILLARAFEQTPTIGGYVFSFEPTGERRTPHIPAICVFEGGLDKTLLLHPKGVILNIPVLQRSLYSSGFFNNIPDASGMIRSVPLVMEYKGMAYPSLPLEMIRIYQNKNRIDLLGDAAGLEEIKIGNLHIPVDASGKLTVNFRGKGHHFRYIGASEVLDGSFDKDKVAGKFVLVGTSAIGLFDLRSTPFDSAIPGVEVHANVIDNILEGDFLHHPSQSVLYDLLGIVSIVLASMLLFSIVGSKLLIPVAVGLLYLLGIAYYTLLFKYGIVLNLLFPLLSFLLTLIVSAAVDYIWESRQKELTKRLFEKKVSPAVMEYLLQHSTEKLVEAKDVEATVFFSDIRNFTTISEQIGVAHKVIELLNGYLTPMVDSIVRHRGTIDKFIGDAIMAYWNTPVPVKNHADEAVTSAIEQIEMLPRINHELTPKYGVEIAIGIGINTGVVTAGDMGSEGRSDYTVIGDTVNLASRMEGLTKIYGTQILISKATKERLKRKYRIRPIDLVEVKGKTQAVEIFEVLCSNKPVEKEEMDTYLQAVSFFRSGKVKEAYALYTRLHQNHPSKLYAFFIKRCETFLNDPNKEFTPILKMTTK